MTTTTNKANLGKDLKWLQQIEADKSFLTALKSTNDPNQQMTNVANVFEFIDKNLDNNNQEISYTIECNLNYIAVFLGNFHLGLIDNGQNLQNAKYIEQRREQEYLWMKCGIGLHRLMIKIINKYKENEWMDYNSGRHRICIFWALYAITNLCLGQNEHIITPIIKETDIFKTILDILSCTDNQNNITWIEQFAAMRALRHFAVICIKKSKTFVKILKKYDLNAVKLTMNACCNAFRLQYFYHNLKPYQIDILSRFYNQDMEDVSLIKSKGDIPTYVRSTWSNTDENTKVIFHLAYRCRIESINTFKVITEMKNPAMLQILLNNNDITSQYYKRFLQVSMLYMRQGKQTFPLEPNTIDAIVPLCSNKYIMKTLASDTETIEMLMIGLRSRSLLSEWNYREIVLLLYWMLCEHKLLPRKYYVDLIYILMDLKEMEWQNFSLSRIEPKVTLSTLIMRMLKYLYGVPRFSIIKRDCYLCSICHEILDYPHTIECGHSFCYGCLTVLIAYRSDNYDYYVNNKRNAPSKCPLCRQKVYGSFDRDLNKSSFVLDRKLLNKMLSESVQFNDLNDQQNEYKTFKGNEYECWLYLEKYHLNKLYDHEMAQNQRIKLEFIHFCEFMQQKTKTYKPNEECALSSKAKDIKAAGNALFKQQKYEDALIKYNEALKVCPIWNYDDRTTYYSNITLTNMKMNDYLNAFRSSQRGLLIHPQHIKLLNNAFLSLDKILKSITNNINLIQNEISIGSDNVVSLNRRIYDILLYQIEWDFEYSYINEKLQKNDTREYMQYLKANDPLLLKIKELSDAVSNPLSLNYDEYQFMKYIEHKNKIKYKIYLKMIDILTEKENENGITIDLLIKKISDFFKSDSNKLLFENLMQNEYWLISFIDNTVNCVELSNDNKFIKLKPQQSASSKDNNNTDETKNDEAEDENKIDWMDWNTNNDDIIISCFYEWEQIISVSKMEDTSTNTLLLK